MLKIGGNEIDDHSFLDKISSIVATLQGENHQVVLVHGGGKEITRLLTKLGVETNFVKGMRYTNAETLDIVEMSLSGLINKRLVRSLQQKKVNAIGLSGVDGRILVAEKMLREGEDVGLVGEVASVNANMLEELMGRFAVVLSPISTNADSTSSLNVNADFAAASVASSLRSELAIFLSNVSGVIENGAVLAKLNEKDFMGLKRSGVVTGGMVPKIEAAIRAVRNGVRMAFVTDADGAMQIISGQDAGTQVVV
ncbi:MAG: acetylglutamate kinase [Bacteroidetes bacterium]|nr:acetylglutamate kinase [Bacteroidota bacterium]MCL5268790.1 acetylglutamate kinase [Bacteroidota bacterium]